MLDSVLSSNLREQAGSNSYDRFEYQVHWIVYHMIKEFKKGKEFLVFCEFHDDMVKSNCIENPECLEFYQIKTTEIKKEWKLKELFKTNKKSHSFLGFIFYNFKKFNSECSKCHFVSNIEPNENIRQWQSVIEDGNSLKDENNDLYEEIKAILKKEYKEDKEKSFDETFDRFIQNTYIYYGELPLNQYEKIVLGEFMELLSDKNIYVSSSNKILKDIIQNVRNKSKTKIKTPISFTSLKDKKGISSEVFKVIQDKIEDQPKKEELYNEIEQALKENGCNTFYYRNITKRLKKHHIKMLDISNSLYIDSCTSIYSIIDSIIDVSQSKVQDLEYLKRKVLAHCRNIEQSNDDLDEVLLEAMLYERLLS